MNTKYLSTRTLAQFKSAFTDEITNVQPTSCLGREYAIGYAKYTMFDILWSLVQIYSFAGWRELDDGPFSAFIHWNSESRGNKFSFGEPIRTSKAAMKWIGFLVTSRVQRWVLVCCRLKQVESEVCKKTFWSNAPQAVGWYIYKIFFFWCICYRPNFTFRTRNEIASGLISFRRTGPEDVRLSVIRLKTRPFYLLPHQRIRVLR